MFCKADKEEPGKGRQNRRNFTKPAEQNLVVLCICEHGLKVKTDRGRRRLPAKNPLAKISGRERTVSALSHTWSSPLSQPMHAAPRPPATHY